MNFFRFFNPAVGAVLIALTAWCTAANAGNDEVPTVAGTAILSDQAIENALQYAEEHASSSVVIMQNGEVIAERNWDFWQQDHSANLAKLSELHRILFNAFHPGDTEDGRAIEDD